ncbi:MAG: TIGR03557 family F420-dependent LLM class oxidoreductase [Chloroflexi bacterium]|nr:TIGR03557 family F420-dependent LLM class oxidoreductase [Chloroflexota bacterium]
MVEIGYALSCEEHRPNVLVHYARRAEQVGFTYALISDHYHPWVDRQGNSPFVWTVIGGIAQATERLRVGTGVTCPIMRYHPAIVAQAAATAAAMMPGRFILGVGTGENLNEHIVGMRWPEPDVRQDMLEEAVQVIRQLWQGDWVSHYGPHFTVENARIYTRPDVLPPIVVAAGGPKAARLAGRIGDGFISLAPDPRLLRQFEVAGGAGKPRFGQISVCWASTEAEARRTAHQWWPNAGLGGALGLELRLPQHVEQAARLVSEEDVAQVVVCGPDPERHIARIRRYLAAGYDHVHIHQIGPDQEGFFGFYQREVLPRLPELRAAA